MLTRLVINHFRGIPHLDLDDFAKVNVFIGTNGAGKTSVLEAAAIVSNPLRPNFLATLGGWREFPALSRDSDYSLRTLFHDLDINEDIRFQFSVDGKDYSLQITAEHSDAQHVELITAADEQTSLLPSSSVSAGQPDDFTGVKLTYITPTRKAEARVRLTPSGTETRTQSRTEVQQGTRSLPTMGTPENEEGLGSFYIHARRSTSASETSQVLTQLFESKSENRFLDAIRRVDKRVIRMLPGIRVRQPIVLVDIGLPRLIPMNALGDGFCRVCLMLTGIASQRPKLLIVDEIDSGLHTSVMEDFWSSVLALTKTWSGQVFCTTHSEEMLRKTLEAFKDDPSALRIYRIDRSSSGEVKAQKYDYERFASAELAGLDVR
jgi:hypothetical protein